MSAIIEFELPEGYTEGAPKVEKQIQNFPSTLTATL